MIHNSIKFDDLAFILLFFFMIIAVISFSDSMNVNTEKEKEGKTESISVFLDSDGNLSQDSFNEGDCVDLKVDSETSWQLVQEAVKIINSQKASVTLVVE